MEEEDFVVKPVIEDRRGSIARRRVLLGDISCSFCSRYRV